MSRRDWLFAAVVAVPLATLGAAALPSSGSTVRLTAVSEGSSHHHHPWRSHSPSGTASASSTASAGASPTASSSVSSSASPSPTGSTGTGPTPDEFIDIRQVRPSAATPRPRAGASRGSFVARCGRNQNGHFNPDNFIVAPGVSNGAHHTHDYVGNLSTNGFSTDASLLAAGTTCQAGDKSAYFWPVLRVRNANDTTGQDNNLGKILTPASVTLRFRGNPTTKVTAMPQFLRIITGDAKAATNGPTNARAQWTCTGFTNRVVTDKYPVCPSRSQVERILDFPSCWDGVNIDSANHRTHVLFPDAATGACPAGTKAIPQLHEVLTYNVAPAQSRAIALDSFPEQLHNPVTDHADFENVMAAATMNRAVSCINRGRGC